MRSLTRSGFVLLELLIGIAVLGILGAGVVAMVRGLAAAATRATSSLVTRRTTFAIDMLLERDLRDGVAGDDSVIDPLHFVLARPVGDAAPCATSDTTISLSLLDWPGARFPEAGRDRTWMLVDPIASRWDTATIIAVASGWCPDSATAVVLRVAGGAAMTAAVRVDEASEVSRYHSGRADWFGLGPLDHSSSVQPFAGPVDPLSGVFTSAGDTVVVNIHPAGAAPTAQHFVLRPR